jgi:hypothetical protein
MSEQLMETLPNFFKQYSGLQMLEFGHDVTSMQKMMPVTTTSSVHVH